MLVEFRVANHRSLRAEQVLTMEEGRVGDEQDERPRRVRGYKTRLLPAAVLYGANASGKSNVLAALAWMKDAVVTSHRFWPPDGGTPRNPFAWGSSSEAPSLFEITFLLSAVRYQYGFALDDERILDEWLYAWPKGRKQTWFERDVDSFSFGEHLRGENRLVEQLTRPNALYLSSAAQYGHKQLAPVFEWFHRIRMILSPGHSARAIDSERFQRWLLRSMPDEVREASQPFLADPNPLQPHRIEALRDLLLAADVGVVDLKLEEADAWGSTGWQGGPARLMLRHQSRGSAENWLPVEEESQGTRTLLLRLGPPLLDSLEVGGVLLIDELEASLHPAMALAILRQFNDPATNPRNSQLIATTHNTNLLGTMTGRPALRRDQIWLTEKDSEGATSLYPLIDFKPRKAENIERGYLQGRYGAIPFLDPLVALPE